jgi:Gram-negative bacterial TonB protein C-terminal
MRSGLLSVGALRPDESNSPEPVALETTVIATGARPGDTAAKRELFTEETQTVLVFERGAVIRLAAAVADGQLLFLTNKKTGKEIVTQVLRKRSFRPTNCYVDLEFTEPCPGFWGIEFPKAATAASGAKVIAKISADDDSDGPLAKPASPPSLEEVERLKREVSELQVKLQSLEKTAPDTAPANPGGKAASEIGADLATKEYEKRLEELFALEAKQEESQGPKRLVAYPQKSEKQSSQKSSGKKWLVAALVVALAAGAAYQFGGFSFVSKRPAAAKPGQNRAAAVVPAPVTQKTQSAAAELENANDVSKMPDATPAGVAKNIAANSQAGTATENQVDDIFLDLTIVPKPTVNAKTSAGRAVSNSRREVAAGEAKASKSPPEAEPRKPETILNAAVAPGADAYVAPKLMHAVKPVAPPEALNNYVTGTVKVDALLDAVGHIKSVTVLSGPVKLHAVAIAEMKQYVYLPAKQNGESVPSHVQVSLQYWYEP